MMLEKTMFLIMLMMFSAHFRIKTCSLEPLDPPDWLGREEQD